MTLGETLRAWRESRGLMQKDAATLLGVSQVTWSDYENDVKLPRVEKALSLVRLTEGHKNAVTLEMIAEAERRRDAARERKTAQRARRLRKTGTEG